MNQSVLVIDDHPDSLQTIKSVFEEAGIQYRVETDSDAVCEFLATATEMQTSSIVMRFSSHSASDNASDKNEGLQLCSRIRAIPGCQSLHILMILSGVSRDDTTQALAGGANDIITLPLRRAELLNRCGVSGRRQMKKIEVGVEDVLLDTEFAPAVVETPAASVSVEPTQAAALPAGYHIHPAENRGFLQESGQNVEQKADVESVSDVGHELAASGSHVGPVNEQVEIQGKTQGETKQAESPQADSEATDSTRFQTKRSGANRIDSAQAGSHRQLGAQQPQVIQPFFDAQTQRYVYPTESANIDAWNEDPDVIRIPLDTVLTCPDCSAVPGFRFGCGDCGSGSIEQEMLIHHFACACVANETEFRDGRDFVCPKCRVDGLVAGTDFESTPGCFTCEDCFAAVDQPELIGHCMQCSLRFPAHKATVMQLFAYQLPIALSVDEQADSHHRPRFTSVRKKSGRQIHGS